MKKIHLLGFLLFSMVSFAQSVENKQRASKADVVAPANQIMVSPKEFYGTIGLMADLSYKTDLHIEVRDKKNMVVYANVYTDVQKSNFKIDLSELKEAKYDFVVKDGNGVVLFNEVIERKK